MQNERKKEKHPDDLKRISFGLTASQTSFLILYHPIKFKRPFNQLNLILTLIFSQLFPNVVPFGQDVVFPRKVGRKLCLITNSYKITAVTTKLPPVTEAERLLGQHIVSVQGKFSHSMSLSTSLSSSSSWRHLTKCRSVTSTITRSGISEETHRYASGDLWLAL